MSDVALKNNLGAQLIRIWNAPTDKPQPLILLAPIGRDSTEIIRPIADELAIQFIHLPLNQVVTPEQHLLLMQGKPRLVAISGIDRLTASERDALVRLIDGGPKTLAVILCSVERDEARRINIAWTKLRAIEDAQQCRASRLANSTRIEVGSAPTESVRSIPTS